MRKYRFIKKIAPVESPINFLEPLNTCPPIRYFHWPGEVEVSAENGSQQRSESIPQNNGAALVKVSELN